MEEYSLQHYLQQQKKDNAPKFSKKVNENDGISMLWKMVGSGYRDERDDMYFP